MKLRVSLLLTLALLLSHGRSVAMAAEGPDLVLQGAKVYPSPTGQSIDNAVVLIHNGKLALVGTRNH